MQDYPRVLVVANECISDATSNGRTLRNFLVGWPKEKIAQFCIRSTAPDMATCDNYYFVSDRHALRSFLTGKPAAGEMIPEAVDAVYSDAPGGRNALTMLIRNLVWSSRRWQGKGFYRWVEEFSPELILFQSGDSAFMQDIARTLKEKYNIPLVIYNSEPFYFRQEDYFRSYPVTRLFYPAFRRQFCKAFDKCQNLAASTVYCCDELKEDYDKIFGSSSHVIHTVTQMKPAAAHQNDPLEIVYLGNLDLDRYKSLVDIGNTLQEISPDLKLTVYGKIPDQNTQDALDGCAGIDYKGFVSYDQVVRIIGSADILVHAECFDDFYKKNLRYAFSTKIADSLGSGSCFLVYAPEKLACTEYLRRNNAAWVVTEPKDLRSVLETLCSDARARMKYVESAVRLAQENHTQEKNTARFQKILLDCASKN